MRRQWVIEGNLKNSARHIYAKRVLRMDEDSGQMTAGEMYDGRGEQWRVQEVGQAQIIVRKLRLAGRLRGSWRSSCRALYGLAA